MTIPSPKACIQLLYFPYSYFIFCMLKIPTYTLLLYQSPIFLQLVTRYGSDPEVTGLVDKYDWYFLPVGNPDGYIHSHVSVSEHFTLTFTKP